MAISNIIKRKIAQELAHQVFLGIRTGMRDGATYYLAEKTRQPAQAILMIKRAVDLPRRARARIDQAIATYGLPALTACITLQGDYTVAELNTELTTLTNYGTTLYNMRTTGGQSWDVLANHIIANVTEEFRQWLFPLPSGYKDIWGE